MKERSVIYSHGSSSGSHRFKSPSAPPVGAYRPLRGVFIKRVVGVRRRVEGRGCEVKTVQSQVVRKVSARCQLLRKAGSPESGWCRWSSWPHRSLWHQQPCT